MKINLCPNCNSNTHIKSGIINNRQRYKCKICNYYFTVNKLGKKIGKNSKLGNGKDPEKSDRGKFKIDSLCLVVRPWSSGYKGQGYQLVIKHATM